jgi:hypothetical protein
VLSGLEHAEDVATGRDRGHRHDAAAERLAHDVHVGLDVFVVDSEGLAGAPESTLDLVARKSTLCFVHRSRTPLRYPAAAR